MLVRSVLFATVAYLAVTSLTLGADPFSADVDFVKKAELASNQEVADAQFALARSNDPAVRKVAQLMQEDGTASNQQLAALAVEKGWPAPELSPPNAMSRYSRERYVARQIRAERNALTFYSEEAANGGDAKLQEFARAALPILRQRLETLRLLHIS